MVANRRIGPESAFLREFSEVRKRVQHLETRPSGNIVVRETLTATDPVTGVSTKLGKLPDGSTGFQPFIGDIVPPPVATVPIVSTQPGTFTVSWDGLFVANAVKPRDFEHVNVFAHKMSGTTTLLSLVVGVLRLESESVLVTQEIALAGETWQFSLESEDFNGNRAVRGARSASVTMQSVSSDQSITNALAAVQADADAADLKATNAQTSANNAQNAADSAAKVATDKGKVWFTTEPPAAGTAYKWSAGAGASTSTKTLDGVIQRTNLSKNPNFEVDTAGYGSANEATLARFASTTLSGVWVGRVSFTAATVVDSGLAFAASLQLAASKTYTVSMDAISSVARTVKFSAQDIGVVNQNSANISLAAGVKTRISWTFQTTATAPASVALYLLRADLTLGTLDVDSVLVEEGTTVGAYFDGDMADERISDLWVDTNDGDKPYKWDSSTNTWVVTTDKRITDAATAAAAAQTKADQAFNDAAAASTAAGNAQTTADGKNRVWYQTTAPAGTGHRAADIWFDTDDGNKPYAWVGSPTNAWTSARDTTIAVAQTTANTAISSQSYSTNASFDNWSSTNPDGFDTWVAATAIKETSIVRRAPNALRFNVPDATSEHGVAFSTTLSHAPNIEYFTIEVELYLVSGGLGGSGVILDWNGMTNNRTQILFASEIPSPTLGKWYRIVKTLRRPTNATGTWTQMYGYLMGQWTGFGAGAAKNIIYDWLNVRPATTEEITAYGTPASITSLTDTVNTKSRTYYQPASPALTGNTVGDTWFDTDDSNKPYVWNGSIWASARDATIATAQSDATTALNAANGKNKMIYSTSPASGTTGYIEGDTWFQRDAAGTIIAQWEFTTSWQARTLNESVIAALSAGKITTGILAADRIGANSINTSKLIVGDMTNFVIDPYMTGSGNIGGATYVTASSTTVSAGAPYERLAYLNARDNLEQPYQERPATGGDQFYVEAWVRATTAATKSIYLGLWSRNQEGSHAWTTGGGVTVAAAQAGWVKTTATLTVPANIGGLPVVNAKAWIQIDGSIAADITGWYVTGWTMRRKNTGSLIVDGAIQAGSLIVANGAIGNAQIADLHADKINAGLIAAARLDAEVIRSKIISATRINAVDIIAQNSITATNGIIGSLDVSKVTAGTMSGSYITAKSIQTNRLVITSTDNLIVEADFSNNGASWGLSANNTINATAGRGSLPAMRFTGTISAIYSANLVNKVSVGSEDRFRASMWVKSTAAIAADNIQLRLRCYTTATTYTDITAASNAVLVANTWTNVSGISPVLPTNTIAIEFLIALTNNATGTITDIDYVGVTRAADGKLVVDGAIDGKTITGALVRTAATGARIVLDATGLRGWDANELNYLEATSAGLSVTGTLKAKGTGYNTPDTDPVATPVEVVIGGATATVKPVSAQTYPPPAPSGSSLVPGIAFKPTSTVMYDYAQMTAVDGIGLKIQSGVTQASVDANPDNHKVSSLSLGASSIYSNKSFGATAYTIGSETGEPFASYANGTLTLGGGAGNVNISSTGTVTVKGQTIEDTGWAQPTMVNSWVNYNNGFTVLQYRRLNGVLHIRGTIKGGAVGSTVTTLPPGFRPTVSSGAQALAFPIVAIQGSTVYPGECFLYSDGVMIYQAPPGVWGAGDRTVFNASIPLL